jgi:DNA-directed RNA polymerase subunit D
LLGDRLKVQILNKNDREMQFLLEETNPQFANALRRIMMTEIPILAIDTVDFIENDSIFYNEIIAHRLGLIPLVFDPKKFHFKEEHKDGKTCSLCVVKFAINKKGPCMVYSKDMKSNDPEVRPLYDNIIIIELFDDQKLKLEAYASLGLGRKHARYQAANAWYRYYPVAKLEGSLKNPEDVVKSCPKKALKISGKKVSVTTECDLCRECAKIAKPKVLKVEGDPTRFIFNVESISGLTAEQIVLQAIDILRNKIKDFRKKLEKLE